MDEKLDDRTLWDITTNEGPCTLALVGLECFILAAMYSIIGLYYWIKYHTYYRIKWRRYG